VLEIQYGMEIYALSGKGYQEKVKKRLNKNWTVCYFNWWKQRIQA